MDLVRGHFRTALVADEAPPSHKCLRIFRRWQRHGETFWDQEGHLEVVNATNSFLTCQIFYLPRTVSLTPSSDGVLPVKMPGLVFGALIVTTWNDIWSDCAWNLWWIHVVPEMPRYRVEQWKISTIWKIRPLNFTMLEATPVTDTYEPPFSM